MSESSDQAHWASEGHVLAKRYRVSAVLGQGSFGRVFRARDLMTGTDVALKEFIRLPGRGDSFLRELGILFELDHPAIIKCGSLFMAGNYRYIVCELMEAGSLREYIGAGRYDVQEALTLLVRATEGVAHAHARNVIHRDLKPENILLTRRGGPLAPKVSDFGISTLATSSASKSCIGSPAYMAPEQFYDQYDGRVDVYALGIMLYEIISGGRPFRGSPAQLMMSHIREDPHYPEWLPKPMLRVLRKALAKKPERRFESVAAFRRALMGAIHACGPALDGEGWPLSLGAVRSVALAGDESYAVLDAGALRLDRRGRPIETLCGVTRIVAGGSFALVLSEGTAHLHTPTMLRSLDRMPTGGPIAVSADGQVAFAQGGTATIVDAHGPAAAAASCGPGRVTALTFVGEDQVLCVAREDGNECWIEMGDTRVTVSEAPVEMCGHPSRYEVACRAGGATARAFFLRLGHLWTTDFTGGSFTCGGDTFYAVTPEGELAAVNVRSARIARTRWDAPLAAVAASDDRLVWATRAGELLCVNYAQTPNSRRGEK